MTCAYGKRYELPSQSPEQLERVAQFLLALPTKWNTMLGTLNPQEGEVCAPIKICVEDSLGKLIFSCGPGSHPSYGLYEVFSNPRVRVKEISVNAKATYAGECIDFRDVFKWIADFVVGGYVGHLRAYLTDPDDASICAQISIRIGKTMTVLVVEADDEANPTYRLVSDFCLQTFGIKPDLMGDARATLI